MTFVEIIGDTYKSRLLDFLGDMPGIAHTEEDLKEILGKIPLMDYVEDLVKKGLITKRDNLYYLNTESMLVKSILKDDFERAKEAADNED